MVICMRYKEKIGCNYHPLIVINLTQTDVITISRFHCIENYSFRYLQPTMTYKLYTM